MKIEEMRIGQHVLVHAQDWSLEQAVVIELSKRGGKEDVTIQCEYGIFDGFHACDFIDNGPPALSQPHPQRSEGE